MILFIILAIYAIGVAGHAQFYEKHMPEDVPYFKILIAALVFPINLFMEIFQVVMGICGLHVEYTVYVDRVTDENNDNISDE